MPPDFREKQLAKFRELAPEMDIVITTALIPGRGAPNLWLAGMVAAMKSGSVAVDLAAERGGNCDLTVTGQKIVSDNGVAVIRLGPCRESAWPPWHCGSGTDKNRSCWRACRRPGTDTSIVRGLLHRSHRCRRIPAHSARLAAIISTQKHFI